MQGNNQFKRQESLKNAIKDIPGIEYEDLQLPTHLTKIDDSFLLYETNYQKERISPKKTKKDGQSYREDPNRLLWSACGAGQLKLVRKAITYDHLLVGSIINVQLSTKKQDELSTLNHPLSMIIGRDDNNEISKNKLTIVTP